MTTVAYKDGILACDGQATLDNLIVHDSFPKVKQFSSPELGSIYIAFAGSVSHIYEAIVFVESIFAGATPDTIRFDGNQIVMLMVDEDGEIHEATLTELSTTINWIPCQAPYAIGSGSHIAIGALEAGATAEEAVLIAGKLDVFTNSNVKTYPVEDLSYRQVIENQIESLVQQRDAMNAEKEAQKDFDERQEVEPTESETLTDVGDKVEPVKTETLTDVGVNTEALMDEDTPEYKERLLRIYSKLGNCPDYVSTWVVEGSTWHRGDTGKDINNPMLLVETLFADGSGGVGKAGGYSWYKDVAPDWYRIINTTQSQGEPQ